jgi:ribosomal protein S26
MIQVLCDFCGKPLPTEKKKDIFGIEHEVITRGKLKHVYDNMEIDLAYHNIDCCEACAVQMDINSMEFKLKILQEGK